MTKAVAEAARALEAALGVRDPQALRAEVADAVRTLLRAPADRRYSDVPTAFVVTVDRIAGRWGRRAQEFVLLQLADSLADRFPAADIPACAWTEFERSICRIAQRAEGGQWLPAGARDDVFLKDAAILSLVLIPCVTHVVHRHSGVPRRIAFAQPPADLVRSLRFFSRAGGFAPFLANHVHPGMLADFGPEGRTACYRIVSSLLERWPESRGLTGMSWYYDPALARVSPHLEYLRSVPLAHGALFLRGPDSATVVEDALARSSRRRGMYDAGQYQPRQYLMAWQRSDLMKAYPPEACR
jgi:hypothetical protein